MIESSNQLVFLENEYDLLEKDLMMQESHYDVFKMLSVFLMKKFDCANCWFYSTMDYSSVKLEFGTEGDNEPFDIDDVVLERKKSDLAVPALLIHLSGNFSAPFKFPDGRKGFLIVGHDTNSMFYTMGQLKDMVPIVRTLNKSLIFVDAAKNRLEKDRLRYAFNKYLSPDIVNNIIKSKETIRLGGEKTELSVIFTDLQNFTDLSDSMAPENILRILNEYLNEMSQVIISLGGTIDKFEGDAIMAFFGAPTRLKDHAIRCCLSALRMKRMEIVLNDKLVSMGLIKNPLVTRIGINSGDVIVGNVGSMRRLDYTIIGSNVNIAARLETANKKYDTTILVSQNTYELVKDCFDFRYVDDAQLKGLKNPIKVYELLSEKVEKIPNYQNYLQTIADSLEEEDIVEL